MDENEKFKTSDIHLTTFLRIKGLKLESIEDSEHEYQNRKIFVFQNSSQLNDLVELFNYAEKNDPRMLMDAREVMRIFKETKVKLFTLPFSVHKKQKEVKE